MQDADGADSGPLSGLSLTRTQRVHNGEDEALRGYTMVRTRHSENDHKRVPQHQQSDVDQRQRDSLGVCLKTAV